MNKKIGLLVIILVLCVVAVGLVQYEKRAVRPVSSEVKTASHAAHSAIAAPRVPAYQSPVAAKTLGRTLPAEQFVGKTREAYKVAKQIPATLAQLPCYCECDRGFGHKSLYSCFEDDHASHCAVCVDEALLAYQLEKEQKMTPDQVREQIIAKYSASNN